MLARCHCRSQCHCGSRATRRRLQGSYASRTRLGPKRELLVMATTDRQTLEDAIQEVLSHVSGKAYIPNPQAIKLAPKLYGNWELGGSAFRSVVVTPSNNVSRPF